MHFHLERRRSWPLPLLGRTRLRVALITPAYSVASASFFGPDRWSELEQFEPEVLVGSAADLHRLAERIDLQTVELTTLSHSIYVLTQVGDKPLDDVLRVVLWQRFGVPVYELYTDGAGALLAYECEAHEGWHIEAGAHFQLHVGELVLQADAHSARRTGLARRIHSERCGCGRPGSRLVDPLQVIDDAPVFAAIA